eukprot:Colp12_sorted_trinity150504_noHs@27668
MYSLLSGLYTYLFRKNEFYVLIVGLDNGGKTTLLEKIKSLFNKNYKPLPRSKITSTVGLNVGKVDVGRVVLMFWDVGGQQELHSIWEKYFNECHAIIYVVDPCDQERLELSREVFERVVSDQSLKGVPLLVWVNKQDAEQRLSIDEVKHVFNKSAHMIGSRDCHVSGTSGVIGDGIKEGIEWIVSRVERNAVNRPPRSEDG